MSNTLHEICCDKCWHSAEKPCPDFVTCLNEGPVCHEDKDCAQTRHGRMLAHRRDRVTRTVVYVGAGTCGLGAGAGKRFRPCARTWPATT